MSRFWMNEIPLTVETATNTIQFFEQSERLNVSLPRWTDEHGQQKHGKTTTLNISSLLESDENTLNAARDIFAKITERIDSRLDVLKPLVAEGGDIDDTK